MNNLASKLKGLNIIIATHIFADGPAIFLVEYLKDKVNTLLFIGHPFSYAKDKSSFYKFYKKGKLERKHEAFGWKLIEPLLYVKEAIYTLFWVIVRRRKIDLFIGSDNYLAFLGIILRKIGVVKEVILYTIDFTPNRFGNKILNFLYHFFDRQCLIHCKIVWNVSEKIAQGREEIKGLKRDKYVPQIVVPLGVWYERIPKANIGRKDKSTIVFMGHILEKQGLDVVIKALPEISKSISKVRLIIIGAGPYENTLKNLVKRLKLGNRVEFLGYIEKHEDVEKILARGMVAVATYRPDPESFTYFADPGKIKNYLAAGLPVFLTNVPAIAKVLEKEKCGVVCKYDANDVANKVIKLMKNYKMLQFYSRNATNFAKQFDWNIVFEKALAVSL